MIRSRPTDYLPMRARRARVTALCVGTLLLGACDFSLSPFDLDPRFQRLGAQMDDGATLAGAERAADVFDPAAPMQSGVALGARRASLSARMVSSGGARPVLATASAESDPAVISQLGTTGAGGQTLVVEGAVRFLPGFRGANGTIRLLGLDALGRVALGTRNAYGDDANRVVASWGGRLGLLSDTAGRNGISVSIQGAAVPGAGYNVGATPPGPATAMTLAMRVSSVRVTALRLQGSASRGAWGLTGGVGSNSGNLRFQRRAQLTYADSTSLAEDTQSTYWDQATANVGVTRRLGRVELALQYGYLGRPDQEGQPLSRVTTTPRHSVSLGAQVVF